MTTAGFIPTVAVVLEDDHGHAVMSHAAADTLERAICGRSLLNGSVLSNNAPKK